MNLFRLTERSLELIHAQYPQLLTVIVKDVDCVVVLDGKRPSIILSAESKLVILLW